MTSDYSSYSDENVQKTPYPIIFCDENLYVCDISNTAEEYSFQNLLGTSMKKRLSQKDICELMSYFHKSDAQRTRGSFVDIENVKGAKCAYVTVTKLFGRFFFEMRLFRSRIAMFKDFDISRLLLSEIPYTPEYNLSRDRISILESRDKLEKIFSAGYLQNLYYSAVDPLRTPVTFDAVEATRRIIADLSYAIDLNGAHFSLTADKKESFSHNVIDVSNFVNLMALLMKICATASRSGKIETSVSSCENRVSIIFITDAKEGNNDFLGGFSFSFLATKYPNLASLIWAAKYISELFGLRCYAELSGKNTLSVELVIKNVPPNIEIDVMHPEYEELERLCLVAKELIAYLEYVDRLSYQP